MADTQTIQSVADCYASGDTSVESRLVEVCEKVIECAVCDALRCRSSRGLSDDALQEGRVAAVRAIRMWKPSKGVLFTTYLFAAVRNAVYRWLAHQPMIRVSPEAYRRGCLPPIVLSLDVRVWRKDTFEQTDQFLDVLVDPRDHIAGLLDKLRLETLLRGRLGEGDFRVFLRVVEGYSAPEVGREFGRTVDQVYRICTLARALIREDEEDEP